MRSYLSRFEKSGVITQEEMGTRLGCATINTYSKWERGEQVASPVGCRALELLLYHTLVKAGQFTTEEEALSRYYQFKAIHRKNAAVQISRPVDVDKKIQAIQSLAYEALCMKSGAQSRNAVIVDGYQCQLTSGKLEFSPGFNRNGKLAGNTLEVLSLMAGLVTQDYQNMAEYANPGSGIPEMVTNIYRENRDPRFKYYNGVIPCEFFTVQRVRSDIVIEMPKDLVTKVNAFLAEGAKLTERDEREELSPEQLRVALRAIIKKMPEALVTDKGEVSLPKPVFTIKHMIGSNQRIKSKDVSIIEQALCHLLGEQYADIREPAAMLVRNAYGRRKADRAHINTHFFKAAIDARSLAITLHQPKALEAINAFMKGMTDPESSAPDVKGNVDLIQGRARKITAGLVVTPDSYYQINGNQLEISDIISRRNSVRVHIINAIERLLRDANKVYLTHSQVAGAIIKRTRNELKLVSALNKPHMLDEFMEHKARVGAAANEQGLSTPELKQQIAELMAQYDITPQEVPGIAMEVDCHFFSFELIGDRGVITFKDEGSIAYLNEALVQYGTKIDPNTINTKQDDDDDNDNDNDNDDGDD